jgi:hypothetical protein
MNDNINNLSDEDFQTCQMNFQNGIQNNKEEFLQSLMQDIQDPVKFNQMVTGLATGDKQAFVDAVSVPEGTVDSVVPTSEEQMHDQQQQMMGQEPDGLMSSAETVQTPVEAAVAKAIVELQSLSPEVAQMVIQRLSTSSSNPEQFSIGMTRLYNARGLDLSEFSFATQGYFSQLKASHTNKSDFSQEDPTTVRLITEYNTLDVPTEFSIFEGASRVMNSFVNYSQDTSMINNALTDECANFSEDKRADSSADPDPEGGKAQVAEDVSMAQQDPNALIEDIYQDLLAEYKELPSEDARREYLQILSTMIGAPAAQEFSEVANFSDDASNINQNTQAMLNDNDTINQMVEAFNQTPDDQKGEFLQKIQQDYGLSDDQIQYIISKAQGNAFSQYNYSEYDDPNGDMVQGTEGDVGGADPNANPYLANSEDSIMIEDAVPEINIPDPVPMTETEIMSIEDGTPLESNATETLNQIDNKETEVIPNSVANEDNPYLVQ